jgi:hypothetical protein
VFGRKGSEENPAGPMELYLKAGFHLKADDPCFHFCDTSSTRTSATRECPT